jgi:PKD repeat protein
LFEPNIAGAGTFNLVYTFTAGTGCGGSDILKIIVNPNPKGDFVLPNLICPNTSITLTTTTNNLANVTGYNWTVTNNGTLSNNILTTYNVANPVATFPENKTAADITYTIKLITTTNFSCVDSVIHTIILSRRPLAQFTTGSNVNCGPALYTMVNGTNNVTSSYLWSTNPNSLVNINTTTSTAPQITFPINNTSTELVYNIRLIATRNDGVASCKDTAIVPITVYPKPIIDFTSLPIDSGCSPLSVNFTNTSNPQNTENINTMSFLWNFGIYGTEITKDAQRTFTNSGTIYSITNVKVIGTTLWGCKDSTTKTIKVFPFPKADFTVKNDSSCAPFVINNSIVTLTQYPIANDLYTWQILNKNGSIISSSTGTTIPAFTINTPNDAIYYRLIVSHARGCKPDTLTRMFVTVANPIPNFTMSDSIGCSPLTIKFTDNSTGGIGVWKMSNGATPANTNPFYITFNSTNIDTIKAKLIVTAGNGCKDSMTKNIIVSPKPIVNFLLSADSICSGSSIFVLNKTVGLPDSIKWNFGRSIIDTSYRYDPIPNSFGYTALDAITTYTIKLYASNICGVDSMSKQLKVLPNKVKSLFKPSSNFICVGESINFENFSKGANDFSWDFNDGSGLSKIVNPIHIYQSAGVYLVKLSANDGCGFDTSSVQINVKQIPQFTISKTKSDYCVNSLAQFYTNTIDSGTIIWYFGDGDSSIYKNPTHAYSSIGIKYIKAVMKSSNSFCTNTKYDTITILPIPVITLTADTNQACAYHLFKFNASSPQTNLFNWYFGDNNTGAGTNLTHLYQFGGTYTVKIVAQTALGCVDSTTKQLVVFPEPISAFSYTPKDTCKGPVTVKFTNLSVGANNYLWNFGNGNTSTNVSPSNTYSSIGSYPIQLISSNQFSCYDTSNSNYFVYQTPIANLDFSPYKGCMPLAVKFENKSIFGTNYLWDFGDGATDTSFSPSHEYLLSGKYKVKLTVKAGTVCFDTFTTAKFVTVFAKPVPVFTSQLSTDKKPYRTVVFDSKTDSVKTFEWYFKGKLIGRGANYTHTFEVGDSGVFTITLKIISNNGCDSSFSQTFELPSYWNGLYVPNAFTPELDNAASKFKPAGLELKEYTIKVYTKWGKLVWQSSELKEGIPTGEWNGLDIEGNPCIQGSYVWIVEKAIFTDGKPWQGQMSSNNITQSSGNVTLIR